MNLDPAESSGDTSEGSDVAVEGGDDGAAEEDAEENAEAMEGGAAEDAAELQAPTVDRPRPRNPWRGRTPGTLNRIRRRVTRGNPITKRHIQQVTRFRRDNPTDVRATLLLAQLNAARGWRTASLTQYTRAYRRDASTRGDARMKRDMIRFAGTEGLHEEATEALIEIYGDEAESSLARAVAREGDAETRARLAETLARIRAL